MKRRRNKRGDGTGEMGSQDSFLDIISNIVGILIILVMIAGVRAQSSPVIVDASETPGEIETVPPVPAKPEIRYANEETIRDIQKLQEEHAEKAQKALKLRKEIEETLQQQALTEEQAAAEAELYSELFALLVSVRAELELYTEEQDQKTKENFDLQRKIMELDAQIEQMERTRLWLGANRPKATVLENVPTPMSKSVGEKEKEIHFRLLGGKISFIPKDELDDLVRRKIYNERPLAKSREVRGSVGPIEGFGMDYVIATYDVPVRDAYGVSINQQTGFVQTVYLAQSNLIEQPLREALAAPRSPFKERLQRYRQDLYTVTVWVYPDSFEEFRELKQFLHANGYRVAAWPRKHDQPISAASDGSKSLSQ